MEMAIIDYCNDEKLPWPIKIYTLGHFAVLKDGEPLVFSAKAPKKLMTLLKVVVALGGQEVAVQQLMDTLWPDKDGDNAQNAFMVALHRLRKLLDHPNAVILHEGLLTLNPNIFWVDAWSCERLLDQADTAALIDHSSNVVQFLERAFDIYRGNFLDRDTDAPWALSLRERMRIKFTRRLVSLGMYFEKSEQLDKAIDCYLRGLEADKLGEAFYQGLMRCYLRLNRRAEGLTTYRHLRDLLSITLGITPSSLSQSLYNALRAENPQAVSS